MAERGRPTLFTQELAAEICQRLATGESLRSICRDDRFPTDTAVRNWALDDVHGFSSQYTRARDLGLDAMAEQVMEISDDSSGDYTEDKDGRRQVDSEHINRSRLRFDARRWYLSKLAPKRYGDKIQQEHTGTDGQPLRIVVTGIPPTPENT